MRQVLLALILVTAGCSGVPYSTQDKLALTTFVTAAVADAYSTHQALGRGCRETNPLLDDHPSDGALALHKLGALGVFYLLGEAWPQCRQQFYYYGAAVQGGAAIWNTQQP